MEKPIFFNITLVERFLLLILLIYRENQPLLLNKKGIIHIIPSPYY
ncbi:MAG TPA: hypothetical protein PK459_00330 [Anaerolineaceae bacterium]|nr:hypothetical protein [Anaerolineaceae bacterium]HQC63529.1 hypothetical protein [Anaerolineaceae bacterium]